MPETRFDELSPELREKLEKFRDEHAGEAAGDVGTQLLFEDDRVRIWEMRLAPGEASDLHNHADPYYLVMLQGNMIAGVPPRESGKDVFAVALPPGGKTVGISKGSTEWAINVGTEAFYEILIELKEGAPGTG